MRITRDIRSEKGRGVRRIAVPIVTSVVCIATFAFGAIASAAGSSVGARQGTPSTELSRSSRPTHLASLASESSSSPEVCAFVGSGDPAILPSVSANLGHAFTCASDSFAKTSWAGIDDDQWVVNQWKGSGYQMIWAVPMLPYTGRVSLAAGATGAYNPYFRTLASNLVAAGMGNSILRIGWEFNQSKYAWYAAGHANSFVAYWRQIVTTMRAVPGAAFKFEWNPSRGDNGPKDQAMGNLASYYPGDAYVDIVGMDVYDTAWNSYPGAAGEFQNILLQTWGLNWLASFGAAHGKPLAIPEMGLGSGPSAAGSGPVTRSGTVTGGDDPTFVTDMLNWISKHNVANFVYWDYNGSSIQNGNNPSAANALRQGLAAL